MGTEAAGVSACGREGCERTAVFAVAISRGVAFDSCAEHLDGLIAYAIDTQPAHPLFPPSVRVGARDKDQVKLLADAEWKPKEEV